MTHFVIFSILALLFCPGAYIALCVKMRDNHVARPPYIPFFILFGTFGGWFFGLAFSPSGVTAMSAILLLTLAPLALIVSSIYLAVRPERTAYHRTALWAGCVYSAVILSFLVISYGKQ